MWPPIFPKRRHLLVTDIGRDGMLQGPNFQLYEELSRRLPNVGRAGIRRRVVARRPRAAAHRRRNHRKGPVGGPDQRSRRRSALPARRIIPCLDVKDGRVVKGVQFRDHRDAGDIVEQAMRYRDEGADELVFYDITASAEGRTLSPELGAQDRLDHRHPVHGCRRASEPRGGRRVPRSRSRQGLGQFAGARAPGTDRRARPRVRKPVRRPWRRHVRKRPGPYRSINIPGRRTGAATPGAEHSTGSAKRSTAAPARSSSTACARTAFARVTTSRTRARSSRR